MVDEDVSSTVVFQVGDLQAMRVTDLGRLEGGIQMLDLHDGLGLLGLGSKAGPQRWAGKESPRSREQAGWAPDAGHAPAVPRGLEQVPYPLWA